ncbi:lysophospholipid acyltransferase family protein [Luteipulveratus sp. YIM 133132]|uniref:lysophospholipid acyltransferase family protein n=1 Tax=Luteipulveratus flavus TaxID=3031728 RepID=UPI0023AF5209|nr:lysophospholipid acyltransferase family protein [Luteipulveratus sp. YIM 133132]MDE9365007.1 lysophospholipid acyltransferase family protein [Luteipulveratus sp. YIM 133132]
MTPRDGDQRSGKGDVASKPARPAEIAAAAKARKRPPRKDIRSKAADRSEHPVYTGRTPPSEDRPLRVVPDIADPALADGAVPQQSSAAAAVAGVPVPGLERTVAMLVGALRGAGAAAGLEGDDLERRVAQTLGFLRRRITGEYDIDEFGFDPDFTEEVWLPLLRPLYQRWFRVEVRGIENVPADGSALVVANHSGTVPIDGLMLQVALHDQHPAHRHVRMLGADLVFQSPVVGELARRAGTTLAANPDAERLLSSGHLAAVFPEGFKGVGKPFSDRYRLQRFGRGGFVSAALRTGAPIVPCSIVGAEEIYPMLGNLKSLARVLGFPYFPVTATFPWLGPLGMVPLPSKWIIEFGAPIDTATFGAEAAEDPMLVFDLTDQVRETIQQTLYTLLLQRRSVFF